MIDRVASSEQDAAIGQLQPGLGAQRRKLPAAPVASGTSSTSNAAIAARASSSLPRRAGPDEHLGQGLRAGAERLARGGQQSLDRLLVERVPLIQMRDQGCWRRRRSRRPVVAEPLERGDAEVVGDPFPLRFGDDGYLERFESGTADRPLRGPWQEIDAAA